MRLPIYQIDAFSSRVFAGNPAAVVPLDAWLPAAQMQSIAAENNLSETAFFVRKGDTFELRWFTPTVEVDLCGHATLASAWTIFNKLEPDRREAHFDTRSGRLTVRAEGELLTLDFPAWPPKVRPTPLGFGLALSAEPRETVESSELVAVFDNADAVRYLRPDMEAIGALDTFAVIATAPGERGCDFVCRYFAPQKGIPEDPVTGRAYCTLTPYWSQRLGKKDLIARQLSARGGEIHCRDLGARVAIAGRAALYLEGTISV